jgi:hypothetical protein
MTRGLCKQSKRKKVKGVALGQSAHNARGKPHAQVAPGSSVSTSSLRPLPSHALLPAPWSCGGWLVPQGRPAVISRAAQEEEPGAGRKEENKAAPEAQMIQWSFYRMLLFICLCPVSLLQGTRFSGKQSESAKVPAGWLAQWTTGNGPTCRRERGMRETSVHIVARITAHQCCRRLPPRAPRFLGLTGFTG